MKTIIQGKEIETTYSVNVHRNDNGEIDKKPILEKKTEVVKWTDMFKFDETITYNQTLSLSLWGTTSSKINLSETESVSVLERIFRADLGAYVLHVDKVLDEREINRTESESELESLICEYNKTQIEKYEKLWNYCKLHHLEIRNTDVDELKKVVYGEMLTTKYYDGGLVTCDLICCSSRPLTITTNVSKVTNSYLV